MTTIADRPSIEPLFASNERLWLRVWGVTQAAAIIVASYVAVDRAGGPRAFLASPSASSAIVVIALLVVYHAIGLRARAWILRRPWAVFVFVPLGWVLVIAALRTHAAAALLIFGGIIQGFIFLPFAWAITILALVIATLVTTIVPHGRGGWSSLVAARLLGVIATGIMVGTVMLYIHRANRDAAIRSRLLSRLDEAQRDLARRAREAGVQEERQRLAQDIQDTLAQGFTSVIKHLEAIELSFANVGSASNDASNDASNEAMRDALPHLAHAQNVSRASLAEIRRLIWALRPPQLTEAPLAAAIDRIVAQWSETHGVAATCVIDPLPALQPDADVIFLRATQESLHNVARHAHAAHVAVSMHCVDGLVLLSIDDDGRGFTEAEAPNDGTMGITGMRDRVRRFGGHVLIESADGSGTSLTVAMPLAAIAASTT